PVLARFLGFAHLLQKVGEIVVRVSILPIQLQSSLESGASFGRSFQLRQSHTEIIPGFNESVIQLEYLVEPFGSFVFPAEGVEDVGKVETGLPLRPAGEQSLS